MKLREIARKKLKAALKKSIAEKDLSYSEIARKSQVHSSQVSRICRGEFKTLSANVVQICAVMGIKPFDVTSDEEILSKDLQRAVLAVWNRSPDDAKRLIRFLEQLRSLRKSEPNVTPSSLRQRSNN